MKIDINKDDLWIIRDAINDVIYRRENCPHPPAWGNTTLILRKLNRKLNRALKKVYSHDCNGESYFT